MTIEYGAVERESEHVAECPPRWAKPGGTSPPDLVQELARRPFTS
jgi:hypothetical protein